MANYTYMLRCRDGSLYTGWTNNLEKRICAHKSGAGGKYTHSHRPVILVYYESFAEKQEAQRREVQIKRLTKAEKEALLSFVTDEQRQEIARINELTEKPDCGKTQ